MSLLFYTSRTRSGPSAAGGDGGGDTVAVPRFPFEMARAGVAERSGVRNWEKGAYLAAQAEAQFVSRFFFFNPILLL